jgi:CubicO group peptidase (beta-lactamase class C family)
MVEQFLGRHYHQGLGVVLNSPPVAWMGPNSKFFGHQGAGGSIGYGDPDARIGFSYAMNRMHMPDSGPRDALAKALFACLEG